MRRSRQELDMDSKIISYVEIERAVLNIWHQHRKNIPCTDTLGIDIVCEPVVHLKPKGIFSHRMSYPTLVMLLTYPLVIAEHLLSAYIIKLKGPQNAYSYEYVGSKYCTAQVMRIASGSYEITIGAYTFHVHSIEDLAMHMKDYDSVWTERIWMATKKLEEKANKEKSIKYSYSSFRHNDRYDFELTKDLLVITKNDREVFCRSMDIQSINKRLFLEKIPENIQRRFIQYVESIKKPVLFKPVFDLISPYINYLKAITRNVYLKCGGVIHFQADDTTSVSACVEIDANEIQCVWQRKSFALHTVDDVRSIPDIPGDIRKRIERLVANKYSPRIVIIPEHINNQQPFSLISHEAAHHHFWSMFHNDKERFNQIIDMLKLKMPFTYFDLSFMVLYNYRWQALRSFINLFIRNGWHKRVRPDEFYTGAYDCFSPPLMDKEKKWKIVRSYFEEYFKERGEGYSKYQCGYISEKFAYIAEKIYSENYRFVPEKYIKLFRELGYKNIPD